MKWAYLRPAIRFRALGHGVGSDSGALVGGVESGAQPHRTAVGSIERCRDYLRE
jgi:hypothetical protein